MADTAHIVFSPKSPGAVPPRSKTTRHPFDNRLTVQEDIPYDPQG